MIRIGAVLPEKAYKIIELFVVICKTGLETRNGGRRSGLGAEEFRKQLLGSRK